MNDFSTNSTPAPEPTPTSGFGPTPEPTPTPEFGTTPEPVSTSAPEPVATSAPEPTSEPTPAPAPMSAPTPAPKSGSNKKLIVIIAVLAVVIIGMVVAIIFLMQPGKQDKTNKGGETNTADNGSGSGSGSESGENPAPEQDLELRRRNTQRSDDISRFITAANSYQANNNGKTPFFKDDKDIDSKFVVRYIDETCSDAPQLSRSDSKILYLHYLCSDDSKNFRDPDGTVYGLAYRGSLDDTSTPTEVTTTWKTNEHIVHIFTYAHCGSDGGVVKGTGERQYAMVYVLEDDSFYCHDNSY